jgi:Family of unknown function (DUF5906)/D5 N terminal like
MATTSEAQVPSTINGLEPTRENILAGLYQYRLEWGLTGYGDDVQDGSELTPSEMIDTVLHNLKLSGTDVTVGAIEKGFVPFFEKTSELYSLMYANGMLDKKDDPMVFQNLFQLVQFLNAAKLQALFAARAKEIMKVDFAINQEVDNTTIIKYLDTAWEDFSDMKPYMKLLHFYFNQAYLMGYKKYMGQWIYKAKYIEGHDTHAWEVVSTIEEYVRNIDRTFQRDMWKIMADKGTVDNVVKLLANTPDYQLPVLVKDRHVFSFKNGVYSAKDGQTPDGKYYDRFYKYGQAIPGHLVSSKYFDTELDDHYDTEDWYDIPTPNLESIFEYQEFPMDVRRIFYAFIGRLLYELNELDEWQCIAFLKGSAGSGKSTILNKICKYFYEDEDVGVMSNNMEKTFGLGSFYQKLMFIAPEIKSDTRIDQAEFQSLVSGEPMQLAIKHQMARSVEWKVPGILASNQNLPFEDSQGSIGRRVVMFEFIKTVDAKSSDMKLADKLKAEIGNIMVKCNRAYLQLRNKHGQDNIWNVLPDYFKATRDGMAEGTNSLENFLGSGKVVFGPELYVKHETFKNAARNHAKESGFDQVKWVKDFYAGVYAKRKLELKRVTRRYPPGDGEMVTGMFLLGCDLAGDGTENPLDII